MTTTTMAPAINIQGLKRTFGTGSSRVTAVAGIDITVQRGEVVALLGPNGAGKTTTLDMLLGLSAPTSGTVEVLGQSPRKAVQAGNLSAVLQTGGLLADITVKETVEVLASFHGALHRVPEVMRLTDLERIASRRVGKCSGGEQQRVKFAAALLPDPDVLVLDEPTAGMDVNARRHFWEVMRADASAGRTIVFATHYLEEAEQFAPRTIVMNRGEVVADGATSELRASLGGRTVQARVPAHLFGDADPLEWVRSSGALGQDPGAQLAFVDSTLTVRTTQSDSIAAWLLASGAHDLEITAPALETAFTTLTED